MIPSKLRKFITSCFIRSDVTEHLMGLAFFATMGSKGSHWCATLTWDRIRQYDRRRNNDLGWHQCNNDQRDVAWRTPINCHCSPSSTPFKPYYINTYINPLTYNDGYIRQKCLLEVVVIEATRTRTEIHIAGILLKLEFAKFFFKLVNCVNEPLVAGPAYLYGRPEF
jgi:hypothetical protein